MTYGAIYEKFCETIKNVDIEDYRPDVLMHTEDVKALEGAGIRIWMKNGDSILYYPSEILEKTAGIRGERMGKYHEAVVALDDFTKAFCRDRSVKDDLAFRCKECGFESPDGICLIKAFKCKHEPEYKDFGCMGDH